MSKKKDKAARKPEDDTDEDRYRKWLRRERLIDVPKKLPKSRALKPLPGQTELIEPTQKPE